MVYTFFKSRDQFVEETKIAVRKLNDNLKQIQIAMSENGVVLQKDSYHFLTRILKPCNRVERTVYGILFSLAYQAEMKSAGAGYVSVVFAANLLESLLKKNNELSEGNEHELLTLYKEKMVALQNLVKECAHSSRQSDVFTVTKNVCENEDLRNAILNAALLAGYEGNISMEDSKQLKYMVELKYGYDFHLRPFNFFLPDSGVWENENVLVLLMDGMIEQVSEMEHLLVKSAETKRPMAIIAQGFSEEVVATLKANQDRGIFNIIPIRLQPDLEGLNILNDIASVVGGDVLSSLKGEQLTFVQYESIPSVDRLRVAKETTTFNNNKTRNKVGLQIKHILEKRSQPSNVEDITDLYDKRLKSLLAHSVVLRLPNMSSTSLQSTRVIIDICLRTIKTVISYGIVDFSQITERFKDDDLLGEALVKTNQQIGKKTLPTLTVLAGVYCAGQAMLTILSSAGFVEIETIKQA